MGRQDEAIELENFQAKKSNTTELNITDGAQESACSEAVSAAACSCRELGRRGEQAAARYLEQNKFQILERNWRCRFGEADLIAVEDNRVLCFIEVKTRRSIEAGIPEEAITADKQRRYERIALSYLAFANISLDLEVRFDCIGICVIDDKHALLRHHRGFFNGSC